MRAEPSPAADMSEAVPPDAGAPDSGTPAPGEPAAIGGYRILRRIAEGGQGVVYLAQAPSGERVALKRLRDVWADDTEGRERFAREVAAARTVARFCVAQVLDAQVDGEEPFVVSEFVDGPSLTTYVKERGPLTGAALERLATWTATALAAIHRARIVHRDFKPGNVVLGPDGPRVIDFGIARDLVLDHTATGRVVGSPNYMAPEQLQGERAGPAADVYAWGATMVYAATGAPPFAAESLVALMYQVVQGDPMLDGVPEPLRGVVERCLAKEPGQRPTAEQLLLDLLGGREAPASVAPDAAEPVGVAAVAAVPAVDEDVAAAPVAEPDPAPAAAERTAPPVPAVPPAARVNPGPHVAPVTPVTSVTGDARPLAAHFDAPQPRPAEPGPAGTAWLVAAAAVFFLVLFLGVVAFAVHALRSQDGAGAAPRALPATGGSVVSDDTSAQAGASTPGPADPAATASDAPAATDAPSTGPGQGATGPAARSSGTATGTSSGTPTASAGGGSPAVSPTPTVTGDPTGIPRTFSGTWTGTARQPGSPITSFDVTLRLPKGAARGTISSDVLGCTGVVVVVGTPTNDLLELRQKTVDSAGGLCATAADITMTKRATNRAGWRWVERGVPDNVATAVLQR